MRTGRKGSGEFRRASWDEALGEIKARWSAIIDQSGPAAILPYSYLGTEGLLNGLNAGDAFFNRLGATISERTFCDSGAITAFFMSCGPTAAVDPESFVHSKYIVLWAINTISTNLHHWPFIAEAQARGAKGRGDRSGLDADRQARRLAPAHPARAPMQRWRLA